MKVKIYKQQNNKMQLILYIRYQRRRHPNTAGIRIHLVPVIEMKLMIRVMDFSVNSLRNLLKTVCRDPAYPGEAYW
jgi:hypothetical protein